MAGRIMVSDFDQKPKAHTQPRLIRLWAKSSSHELLLPLLHALRRMTSNPSHLEAPLVWLTLAIYQFLYTFVPFKREPRRILFLVSGSKEGDSFRGCISIPIEVPCLHGYYSTMMCLQRENATRVASLSSLPAIWSEICIARRMHPS
ncbi:hypothetical protein BO82DRAFT_79637 [Aspergillus uvarum CBS 121591]|uniref:Uncharacterized protein n=1 Tax=Aspergillus uvarum CBS 121591 TaxID=1448315 RepID=A0A319CSL8_9EURO|nr:hypothetical protein BO82DRAFT_79637 [Aspergillus uvarum CBS 121591]PYH81753.1 hypothetical protein BO82DRAFT_79637 [Aspergillus uvarum CBS 121591]